MDLLDTAREFRFSSAWERRFHDYEMLLLAGVGQEEAERIATLAAADRGFPDAGDMKEAA